MNLLGTPNTVKKVDQAWCYRLDLLVWYWDCCNPWRSNLQLLEYIYLLASNLGNGPMMSTPNFSKGGPTRYCFILVGPDAGVGFLKHTFHITNKKTNSVLRLMFTQKIRRLTFPRLFLAPKWPPVGDAYSSFNMEILTALGSRICQQVSRLPVPCHSWHKISPLIIRESNIDHRYFSSFDSGVTVPKFGLMSFSFQPRIFMSTWSSFCAWTQP